MEDDSEEIRYVGKRFKCHNCMTKFTKLVRLNEQSAYCDNCHNISFEITEEEYKRKSRSDIDQAPRMVFTKSQDRKPKEERKNIKGNSTSTNNQPNINTKSGFQNNFQNNEYSNPNCNINQNSYNNYGTNPQSSSRSRSQYNNNPNNQRRNQPNNIFNIFDVFTSEPFTGGFRGNFGIDINMGGGPNRNPINFQQDFFGGFFPFFSSPFTNNVSHHSFHSDVFDPMFEMFGTSFNNVFRDNFSSNFRSNLFNDNIINIIEESFRRAQEHKKPPVAKEAIERLKKFKMNEKFCKKNDKGELEHPTCSVCLCEIKMDEETILVPCGHMYHSQCILEWFEQNNTCPVCRFELPPRKS